MCGVLHPLCGPRWLARTDKVCVCGVNKGGLLSWCIFQLTRHQPKIDEPGIMSSRRKKCKNPTGPGRERGTEASAGPCLTPLLEKLSIVGGKRIDLEEAYVHALHAVFVAMIRNHAALDSCDLEEKAVVDICEKLGWVANVAAAQAAALMGGGVWGHSAVYIATDVEFIVDYDTTSGQVRCAAERLAVGLTKKLPSSFSRGVEVCARLEHLRKRIFAGHFRGRAPECSELARGKLLLLDFVE